MLLGIAISPLIADFFGQPSVAPLFAATSVVFLLWALCSTQSALLTREMNFRASRDPRDRGRVRGCGGGDLDWASPAPARGRSSARDSCRRARRSCSSGRSRLGGRSSSTRGPACATSAPTAARRSAPRCLGYLVNNVDNLLVGRFLGSVALGSLQRCVQHDVPAW